MHNAATPYTTSAGTDVAAYEDLPGHHLLAVRNLIATTNDESYHSFASELPPATSHGYVEWDFSGVPDPVMFQRFLDAADYWFGCSGDSSVRSYDPTRECFVVVVDDQTDCTNARGLVTEKPPEIRELACPRTQGRARPHLAGKRRRHQCAAGSSARARGKARGGVPHGMTASRLHHWRGLRTHRMRA
jgi:hypothetical protein